jgi:hypothetical protein
MNALIGDFVIIMPDAGMDASLVGRCGKVERIHGGKYLVSFDEGLMWFRDRNVDTIRVGDEVEIRANEWNLHVGERAKIRQINRDGTFFVVGEGYSHTATRVKKVSVRTDFADDVVPEIDEMFGKWADGKPGSSPGEPSDEKQLKAIGVKSKGKVRGGITGIRALAKLPYNCTITNAKALDMTPEEFAEVQQKNAKAARNIGQIDPVTAARHTDG